MLNKAADRGLAAARGCPVDTQKGGASARLRAQARGARLA